MDFFSFSGWKKKALRFVVKSAIGRFLKGVEQHHVVEPTFSGGIMSFGLERLEVDEELINHEFLQDAPLRMVCGAVNSIQGDIALSSSGMRNTVMEGIDLTFDLVTRRSMQPAATEDEQRQQGRRNTDGGAAGGSASHSSGSDMVGSHPYGGGGGGVSSVSRRSVADSRFASCTSRYTASHRMSSSSGGSAMFSSLLSGAVTEEDIANEILDDDENDEDVGGGEAGAAAGSGGHVADDRTIDDGVTALSQTIKALVHSLSLTVKGVNIRIRCPPPGMEIIPGEPLPYGTVELLVSLPNEVSIRDDGTNERDVGNSFKKIISFSGIRVSIYEATTASVEVDGDAATQRISFSDIIMSGGVDDVDNQITIQLEDVLPDSLQIPKWTTTATINQMHAILGPTQLLRLSMLAQRLLDAPEVDSSCGKTREEAKQNRSKFQLKMKALSVSVLYDDAKEIVGNAWRNFSPSAPIERSLQVRYYAIRVYDARVMLYNSSLPTDEGDDKYFGVFDRYGGSSTNFGVVGISIVEFRPGYPQLPLLAIGERERGGRGERGGSSTARSTAGADGTTPRGGLQHHLVCMVRTTCPMTVRLARECGVAVPDDFPTSIVRQDVRLQTQSAIDVHFDVEVLERLIKFGKRLEYLLSRAAYAQHLYADEAACYFDDEGMAMTEGTPTSSNAYTSPTSSDAIAAASGSAYGLATAGFGHFPTASGGAAAGAGGYSTTRSSSPNNKAHRGGVAVAPSYTVLRTASVVVESIKGRLLFPMTRKPSRDLYGPLTQRLFRQVLEHAPQPTAPSPANSARTTASTSSWGSGARAQAMHWRKTLVIEVSDVAITMPTGGSEHIVLDADQMAIMEWDVVSGEMTVLCKAQLRTPAQRRQGSNGGGGGAQQQSQPQQRRGGGGVGGGLGAPTQGHTSRQRKLLFDPPHTLEIIRKEPPAPPTAPSVPSAGASRSSSVNPSGGTPHPPPPGGRAPPLQPCASTAYPSKEVQFRTDVSWHDTERVEAAVAAQSDVVVYLHIPSLRARLHQDDLLLLLFMMGELSDCVTDAMKSLDPIQAEEEERRQQALGFAGSMDDLSRHYAANTFAPPQQQLMASTAPIPAFGASVRIVIGQAEVVLWAPRLGADGLPIGEPLWMTISPENRRRIREEMFYHMFTISAKGLGVFLYNYAPEDADKFTSDMLVNVRAAAIDLFETLPELTVKLKDFSPPSTHRSEPRWGRTIPLANCYGSLYNKSHNNNGDRDQNALTLCVRREMRVTGITNTIHILLDRLSIVHQAAYDGDHWLLALLQFVSDAPVTADLSDDDDESDAADVGASAGAGAGDDALGDDGGEGGSSAAFIGGEVNPPTIKTSVFVVAKDTLIQYQPFGYVCRLVVLVPTVRVDTGTLLSSQKRAVIGIGLDEATVFLINTFVEELLQHDINNRGQSGFGVTQGGIAKDLENLGFIPILSLSSQQPTVRTETHPYFIAPAGAVRGSTRGAGVGGLGASRNAASAARGAGNRPSLHYDPMQVSWLGGGGCSVLAYLPDPCIKIRSFDVIGKPVVVEISRLAVELACACDSFYLFQTVLSHYLGGQDLQYMPTPEALVAAMDGKGRSRQREAAHHNRPPAITKVPNLSERIAAVLAKSIFGDEEGAPMDPSAAVDESEFVTFDADNQQVLPAALKRQQDAYELARAIVESSTAAPITVTLDDGDVDDFEVIGHAEGAHVTREKRQWSINPSFSRRLDAGMNNVAARADLREELFAAPSGNAASRVAHHVATNTTTNTNAAAAAAHSASPNADQARPKAFDFSELISDRSGANHFSLKNPFVCQGDDGNAVADARLVDCPEVAVEIRVSECTGIVRFFGGLDFAGVKADREYYGMLMQANSMAFFTGDPSNPENVCYRSTRARNVSIEAQLFSISAQVDVFVPGRAKAMQLILKIREGRVLDNIDASAVRTILMCSTPATHRDNEGNLFEMKWVSTMASRVAEAFGDKRVPMEDISVRLQPLILNIHRRTIDLILDFMDVSPEILEGVLQIDAKPSDMFFRRLFIHPLSIELYVITEAKEIGHALRGSATRGSMYEFVNLLPSIEKSRVSLGKIEILNAHIDDLGERILDVLKDEMWSFGQICLILSGLEVVRTVNEAGQAVAELVIRPLDYYRRNRSLYTGIVKGFSGFGKRIGAETMRVGASTTRAAHHLVHAGTSMVTNAPPMPRGAQPNGTGDGLARGRAEIQRGVAEAFEIIRFSLSDEGRGSALLGVPLAPLAMTDGMFRAMTQVLEGIRNSFRPEERTLNNRLYKSRLESGNGGM